MNDYSKLITRPENVSKHIAPNHTVIRSIKTFHCSLWCTSNRQTPNSCLPRAYSIRKSLMQIICMYAANSHALLSFKFNYSNISIRPLLYNIVQTNGPAHFCRIVLNTFSYFNKSEVVMINEWRGERSFVLGALDFKDNTRCV